MPLKAGADPQRHLPRLDGRLAARPLRNVPRPARSGLHVPMPLYCVRASHSTFSMTVSTRPGAGGLVCKDVAREGRETLSTPSFIPGVNARAILCRAHAISPEGSKIGSE